MTKSECAWESSFCIRVNSCAFVVKLLQDQHAIAETVESITVKDRFFVCAENEKDRQHLVGTASDDKKYAVNVAAKILSEYVGSYEFFPPENPTNIVTYNITVDGGVLSIDTEGKDKIALIPLSETAFSMLGDRLRFDRDERGQVKNMAFIAAEGDLIVPRKRSTK